ncbi:hypothetical protein U1Q18_028095, partial [Sarracenia purpurea var. burkii]
SIAHVRGDTAAIHVAECLTPAYSDFVSPFPSLVPIPDLLRHMKDMPTHVAIRPASSHGTGHPDFSISPETSPGNVPILPPVSDITTPGDDV